MHDSLKSDTPVCCSILSLCREFEGFEFELTHRSCVMISRYKMTIFCTACVVKIVEMRVMNRLVGTRGHVLRSESCSVLARADISARSATATHHVALF